MKGQLKKDALIGGDCSPVFSAVSDHSDICGGRCIKFRNKVHIGRDWTAWLVEDCGPWP